LFENLTTFARAVPSRSARCPFLALLVRRCRQVSPRPQARRWDSRHVRLRGIGPAGQRRREVRKTLTALLVPCSPAGGPAPQRSPTPLRQDSTPIRLLRNPRRRRRRSAQPSQLDYLQ
jgi:hypothetical protein